MSEQRKKTPTDVLIEAMEQAEEMDKVLVIYTKDKNENTQRFSSMDSDLTVAETLWMMRAIEHWLLNASLDREES